MPRHTSTLQGPSIRPLPSGQQVLLPLPSQPPAPTPAPMPTRSKADPGRFGVGRPTALTPTKFPAALDRAMTQSRDLAEFFTRQLHSPDLLGPSTAEAALRDFLRLFDDQKPPVADGRLAFLAARARELDAADRSQALGLAREIHGAGVESFADPGVPDLLRCLHRIVTSEPGTPEQVEAMLAEVDRLGGIAERLNRSATPVPADVMDVIAELGGLAGDPGRGASGEAPPDIARAARETTQAAASRLRPPWEARMGNPPLSAEFERLQPRHLDTNRVNHQWRSLKLRVHQIGAKIDRLGLAPTLFTSPSMRAVERNNALIVSRSRGEHPAGSPPSLLANLTPDVMTQVRRHIGSLVRNSFATNAMHTLKKAGGRRIADEVRQAFHREPKGVEKTRAQVVSEMLDLDDAGSAIRKAIDRLEARFRAHGRTVEGMSALERADFVTRLSTAVLDEATRPTHEEAVRASGIVQRLGSELKQEIEQIHLDGMKAAVDLAVDGGGGRLDQLRARLRHPTGEQERIDWIVEQHLQKTSAKIEEAIKRAYDRFRREFGNEFGYDDVKAQLRENSALEYYRHLLAYGPRWAATMNVANRLLQLIPTAGPGLAMAGQIMTLFTSSLLSQTESGLLGSASNDYKPLETSGPRGINDWQTMDMERTRAKYLQKLACKLGTEYAEPSNAAHQACMARAELMERKGYGSDVLLAIAPHLQGLVDLQHMVEPDAAIGMDDPVAPPVRISLLLHRHLDALPDLQAMAGPLGRFGPAEQGVVLSALVASILSKAPAARTVDLDPQAILGQLQQLAAARVAQAMEDGDEGAAALRRALTPSRPILATCGTEFGGVMNELLKAGLEQEKELYASKSFLVPQFKGLFANALTTLVIQIAMYAATTLATAATTAAATAAAGPVAGAAAGAAVGIGGTAATLGATKLARNVGASRWFRTDEKKQTDYQLFNLMHPRDHLAFLRPQQLQKLEAARVDAFMNTHSPIYEKRVGQLRGHLAARIEDQVVKVAEDNARLGTMFLCAIENDRTGDHRVVAKLIDLSVQAGRKFGNAARHAELQSRSTAYQNRTTDLARAAAQALRLRVPEEQEVLAISRRHETAQRGLYAVKRTTAYLDKQSAFVKNADGRRPAEDSIDALRQQARELFDGYLAGVRAAAGKVSQGEWDGLRTLLRFSHADPASEEWIAATQLGMERDGVLDAGHFGPAFVANLALPDAAGISRAWTRITGKTEERLRIGQIMLSDMFRLDAGRFDEIQDPTGALHAMLDDPIAAFEKIKYDRIASLLDTTMHRGLGRAGATLLPSTPQGLVSALVQWGSVGFWAAGLDAEVAKEFRIQFAEDFEPFQRHSLKDPTVVDFARSGVLVNPSSIGSTVLAGTLGAVQPSGNPVSFAAMGHKGLLASGFAKEHPAFWPVIEKLARQDATHALSPSHWGAGLVPFEAIENETLNTIGAAKIASHHKSRVHVPPDALVSGKTQEARWKQAKKESAGGFWARHMELMNPRLVLRNAQYGRNARKHYAMTQHDRHRIAHQFARVAATARLAPPTADGGGLGRDDAAALDHVVGTVLGDPACDELLRELGAMRTVDGVTGDADRHRTLLREATDNMWVRLALCNVYGDLAKRGRADAGRQQRVDALRTEAVARITSSAGSVLEELIQRRIDMASSFGGEVDANALQDDVRALEAQVAALETFQPDEAQRFRGMLDDLVQRCSVKITRL